MRRLSHGFILPLTIWILAAVTVVAAFFAQGVQRSLQLAESSQQRNDAEIELSNARSELLFRLATRPMSPCGLGGGADCIALDDRPYLRGGAVLQLQDARGLLNLGASSDDQIDRLLSTYDLPPDQRARLIDTLRDYADEDNLRRLNGAESQEYLDQGLPPPRNQPLLSPLELKAVLGWPQAAALWQGQAITEVTTVGTVVALNPNTAPERVLRTLPGIVPEIARAIIDQRQLGTVSPELVDRLAGGGLLQLPALIIAFPADTIRLTLSTTGSPWVQRYNVRLTPRDPVSPWRVLYSYRLEKQDSPTRAAPSRQIASLPPLAVQAPAQAVAAPP